MLATFASSVSAVERIAPNVYRFVFALREPSLLNFQPGQYILLKTGSAYRQYSISSSPEEKNIVETVVDLTPMGVGSQYLLSLNLGDVVSFRAPLGIFTLKKNNKPKIFLATGTGIAPIKSMILALAEQGFTEEIHLFWGMRRASDMYFQEVWNDIAKKTHLFNHWYCLSKHPDPLHRCIPGRIQDGLHTLKKEKKTLKDYEFYLCGRPQIVDNLKTFLYEQCAVEKEQLFHEKFS